jgi:hypothetical protein
MASQSHAGSARFPIAYGCASVGLKSISREDAIAEGYATTAESTDPIRWFKQLWDCLCDEKSKWNKNPLVWVIGFSIVDIAVAMDESP